MSATLTGLSLLTFPLMIYLFLWQGRLNLSSAEHVFVEALIVCGVYWLILRIIRLDEWLQNQSRMRESRLRLSEDRLAMLIGPVYPAQDFSTRSNGPERAGKPEESGDTQSGSGKGLPEVDDLILGVAMTRK